jgi:hypothetical protein
VVSVPYRCGAPVTFVDTLAKGTVRAHDVRLVKSTNTITFVVRWSRPTDVFDVTRISLAERTLAGRGAAEKLKITKTRTKTSLKVRVQRLKPGKLKPGQQPSPAELRFGISGTKAAGTARVQTRVSQSR